MDKHNDVLNRVVGKLDELDSINYVVYCLSKNGNVLYLKEDIETLGLYKDRPYLLTRHFTRNESNLFQMTESSDKARISDYNEYLNNYNFYKNKENQIIKYREIDKNTLLELLGVSYNIFVSYYDFIIRNDQKLNIVVGECSDSMLDSISDYIDKYDVIDEDKVRLHMKFPQGTEIRFDFNFLRDSDYIVDDNFIVLSELDGKSVYLPINDLCALEWINNISSNTDSFSDTFRDENNTKFIWV